MTEAYRHGDLIFTELSELPASAKAVASDTSVVLALGEVTGHKHVMVAEKKQDMQVFKDSQNRYILKINAPTKLSHEEHRTLTFKPGLYLMDYEREHDYFTHETRQVLD